MTLEAHPGEVFGLLGPNGAGKTTLIKTLLGIIQPSGGNASLFGVSVRSPLARNKVGYLPESLRIDRHHTATSALGYYGRLSRMSPSTIAKRREELLRLVGLENRARESVRRFSKGMYQRLGLAQALMHDPDLLILDEPTDGLDPVGRTEVRRVLERLRDDGKTIFLNSHILQEVEMVCSRVAILSSGTLKGLGTIDELRGNRPDGKRRVDLQLWMDPQNLVSERSAEELPNAQEFPERLHVELTNAGFEVEQLRSLANGVLADSENGSLRKLRLNAAVADQREIDSLVDWLRARDVSILEIKSHQPSLEETFLRLVGNQDPEADTLSSQAGGSSRKSSSEDPLDGPSLEVDGNAGLAEEDEG